MTASGVRRDRFGALPNGSEVAAITLSNRSGMRVTLISYGAGIQSVIVPDRDGALADVALGHATLDPYLAQPQFIGSTVGRVANRIAGGHFTLDGQEYRVPLNDGPNALHGGPCGFDKVNWEVVASDDSAEPSVTFAHLSPHGDQGFPGALRVTATYTLRDENTLTIDYRATTDRPTLVNITNHAYWNLAGEGSPGGAMDHLLTIFADEYLPVDSLLIPTGEFRSVEGTPFDFRLPTVISARLRDASDEQIGFGRGYDHNWVISRKASEVPRIVARLEHPSTGRVMEMLSNQPGLQFYSGNFFDGTIIGKSNKLYRMGDCVVLEPQMFPDAPNQPHFGSLRLEPADEYHHQIVLRFSTVRT